MCCYTVRWYISVDYVTHCSPAIVHSVSPPVQDTTTPNRPTTTDTYLPIQSSTTTSERLAANRTQETTLPCSCDESISSVAPTTTSGNTSGKTTDECLPISPQSVNPSAVEHFHIRMPLIASVIVSLIAILVVALLSSGLSCATFKKSKSYTIFSLS